VAHTMTSSRPAGLATYVTVQRIQVGAPEGPELRRRVSSSELAVLVWLSSVTAAGTLPSRHGVTVRLIYNQRRAATADIVHDLPRSTGRLTGRTGERSAGRARVGRGSSVARLR
jgi:hypothetical protein